MLARFGFLTVLLALLLAVFASSCGTSGVGTSGPNLQAEQNKRTVGVAKGGFEVIRQNQQGNNDEDLNSTLGLELRSDGNETALVISVDDSSFTTAVTLDVNYDAAKFHPVRTEFTQLLGAPGQVLTASFLDTVPGTAGLGAAALGDFRPASLRGEFATVYFAPGPDRDVSAAAGDAHENPLGVADVLANVALNNLTVDTSVADTVTVTWTSAWMIGNGDGNKEVNAADLVPIAGVFKKSTATDFNAVKGDYDRNTEANAADLTQIAKYFKRFTDAYLVEASDNDGTGAVTVATLDGATDQQPPVGPAAAGDLTTILPFWRLTIDPASTFTFAQLQALDVNADGSVRISITPKALAGALDGVKVDQDITVGPPPPTTDQLVINGFAISVNDGAVAPAEVAVLDDANTSLTVQANDEIGFTLKTIKGTFNGTPFDGRPAADPTEDDELHQADYDAAFDAARDLMISAFSTGGDASARRTSEWCVFPTGNSPYLGVLPTPGTIFPDYDPESVLPTSPEGTLTCTLPIEGGALPGGGTAAYPADADLAIKVIGVPVVNAFQFDVEADPAQATLTAYIVNNDGAGTPSELVFNHKNLLQIDDFSWGSGGVPADLSTVQFELIRIAASGLATGANVQFTYIPILSPDDLSPGEFSIRELTPPGGPNQYFLLANVNTASLVQGGTYVGRILVDGVYTSVNLPKAPMTTAPPPPPQALQTIPSVLRDDNNNVQIFYADPTIRRNGAMVSFSNPGPPPQDFFNPEDSVAFNDILRTDGDEFAPLYDTSTGSPVPYPKVVVKKNSVGTISGPDDPDAEAGVSVIERGANRIVLDVTALSIGGGFGDPPVDYSYIVYAPGGIALGQGTFAYDAFGINQTPPGNLQWGVNVFNRVDLDLADRDYDPANNPNVRTVDGTNVDTTLAPPVMFFEFSGGSPYDYNQNEELTTGGAPAGTSNPYIYIENPLNARVETAFMGLRVTGVTPNGSFLLMHTVTEEDFLKFGQPGWPGIFDPGTLYDMWLIDPATNLTGQKLAECKFPGQLIVVGDNPNQ